VTTNSIQRTVRMGVLSTFLALAAFAFLAFGTASAHTLNSAQTTSGTTTTVVRMVTNSQGGVVFRPSAITIISGTPVRIVNKTAFARFLVINGQLFRLNSGASMTITPVQSQTVFICGGAGTLTITVT
jgi:plastocyanin